MLAKVECQKCQNPFPITEDRCPHCGFPGLFPNVRMAEDPEERRALDRRYERAIRGAADRDCLDTVQDFETGTAASKAVIARSLEETSRLASGDHQLYPTYHQLTEIEFRIPDGSKWDLLRKLTDQTLFGDYMAEIRFAALSLDGLGLMSYGDCCWVLREEMIAYRASVFEENSVMFMERHGVRISDANELPPGHRAPWEERAKLCVAKLADRIDDSTGPGAFPELLLRQGTTSEDDEFVEVHVGGPMTVRTMEQVLLKRRTLRTALGKAVREKLERFGVAVRGW